MTENHSNIISRVEDVLAQEMRLKNYSTKTSKAYKSCIQSFAQHIAPKYPREADTNEIRNYLLYTHVTKRSLGKIKSPLDRLASQLLISNENKGINQIDKKIKTQYCVFTNVVTRASPLLCDALVSIKRFRALALHTSRAMLCARLKQEENIIPYDS